MTEDADHTVHCHSCGRLISGPVCADQCPICGSHDVALLSMSAPLHPEAKPQNLSAGTTGAGRGKSTPAVNPAADASVSETEVTSVSSIPTFYYLFPWPPEGVPKALWQHLRPLRFLAYPSVGSCVVVILFALASLLTDNLILTGVRSSASTLLIVASVYLALPSGFLVSFVARRRLRRFERVIVADNRERCLECGYSLKGLPAEHRCPECGEPYDMATVRETWRRYFEAQK